MLKDIKCPLCGAEIIETSKGFSCSNWKKEDGGCKFVIWKETFGAVFNGKDVDTLIKGGEVRKNNVSKAGNPYLAKWSLDDNKKLHFVYIDREKDTKACTEGE